MTIASFATVAAEPPHARRNALLLSAAAAFSGAIPVICVSLGGLAGSYLLGADKSLATLPVSGFNIGVALGTLPAALLMRRVGRRFGFLSGASVAIVGSLIAGYAILAGAFAVLAVGLVVVGFSAAFAQQYRFAAADAGSPAFRARAISWVLAGGIAAAVIGPQTAIFTGNLFSPIPFAGSFFAIGILALIAIAILSQLTGEASRPPPAAQLSGGRSLAEIARQPRFIIAIVCAIGSYALMSLLMTAAPLAIVGCGLGANNAALGIQWHVLAMYVPSFVSGPLIVRYGKEPVIALGMLLLTLCAMVAVAGIDLANFWGALILLGVGWNFGFIGATAMLTETYRPEEKNTVQGLNDFLVFSSVAIASLSSGKLYAAVGWERLNIWAFPLIAICVGAVATAFVLRRRRAA
jgi:predicted MFS family arabinose efflux permease